MLSKKVPNTFSVEKGDFPFVSGRSGLNFNVHSIHPLMENNVILLNDFRAVSTKRLVEQILINKIWSILIINPNLIWYEEVPFRVCLQVRCKCYVTFLVANNAFSNNFKYPYTWKSRNRFENIKVTLIQILKICNIFVFIWK